MCVAFNNCPQLSGMNTIRPPWRAAERSSHQGAIIGVHSCRPTLSHNEVGKLRLGIKPRTISIHPTPFHSMKGGCAIPVERLLGGRWNRGLDGRSQGLREEKHILSDASDCQPPAAAKQEPAYAGAVQAPDRSSTCGLGSLRTLG